METIKEEKKADLEQLLNSLIEKGWKLFGREKTLHIDCYDKCKGLNYKWIHLDGGFMNEESRTLRELVSIDSGLWQFVCENEMVKKNKSDFQWWKQKDEFIGDVRDKSEYQYRLIESSLKDESELEDFLLSNIKIGD